MDELDALLVGRLAAALEPRGWGMATAESCTGGRIAGLCTDRPGSSAWFDRAFVTYSNAAKVSMLGVDPRLIDTHGAVSEAVVRAMATGALARSSAHVAVAVTGVAGPSGGSAEKPVGTVWFGWAGPWGVQTERQCFPGGRSQVRGATVTHALQGLLARIGDVDAADAVKAPSESP